MQPQKKNVTIYPENYVAPTVTKLIPTGNTNQYYRQTMQPINKNQQIYNIQYANGQNIMDKNSDLYNLQNIQFEEDKRKTYNPPQLKGNKLNEPTYYNNDIIEETYYKDPKTGEKIILETKKKRIDSNNQIYNEQYFQNEDYFIHPETGQKIILNSKPQQYKNNVNTNAYQPQPVTTINPTASVYRDIYSSIDPNSQKNNEVQIQESPIIETLAECDSDFNFDIPMDLKKSATLMTVSSLANIPYNNYRKAEFSKEPFFNIAGYGFNSYNGKVKKFNEDRIKNIVDCQFVSKVQLREKPKISYFSIFDGHSGNKCSDFLKENLHLYLFNSSYFPHDPIRAIRESFKQAEENFRGMVYDINSNILLDKSGSCALVMLIINDILYAINLGDSRALYSYNTGKYLYQITRDHKPNDEVERKRIENAGGKVFYANTINRNGIEIELKEEQFGKGFSFPYRIKPGKIAVSILYNNLGRKKYW
jgi:hypothetical protein